MGIGLVPQGRRIFPNLTVTENLLIARRNGAGRWDGRGRGRTRLMAVRSRAVEFAYEIVRSDTGAGIASVRTTLVSVSPEGRPVALPAGIRALLARGPFVG